MISRSRLPPFAAAVVDVSAAVDGGAAGSSPGRTNLALSAQLRDSTHSIHASTEAAFDLDRWLADRESYAALLTLLRGFHTAVESALGRIQGWDALTPGIDLSARRRAFRLDQDLAALGHPASSIPAAADAVELASIADGLGCLYVSEGSSLGGRVIAAHAQTALGPRLPTAFFADPARNVGRDWNALRASLDSFGEGERVSARPAVIAAAHRTFAAFAGALARGRSRR